MSSHGDPVQEIQAYLEVDALRALTEQLRNGDISSISKKFDTVVHIGHSFGSEHSYLLTAMYPELSDGIALTGFSHNGSFLPFFELGGNFVDAPNLGLDSYVHGYLAPATESGVQTNFFSPGSFPPELLTFATNNGQPVTQGELLTIGGEIGVPNTFCGPVLVITGERDVPYCGGDCLSPPTGYDSIPAAAQEFFPNTVIEVDIVPGAGHGLNIEYSHPYTYSHIFSFFEANGLSASATNATKTCQPGSAGSASPAAPSASGSAGSGNGTAPASASSGVASASGAAGSASASAAASSAAPAASSAAPGQQYGQEYGHGYGWGHKGGPKGGWKNWEPKHPHGPPAAWN